MDPSLMSDFGNATQPFSDDTALWGDSASGGNGNAGSGFSSTLKSLFSPGGTGMGDLENLLGGSLGLLFNKNPGDAAMPYLNQISGIATKYLGPYAQAGMDQISPLNSQYNKLTTNPGGFLNDIGSSFHQSPGFQFALNNALQASNRAAAAGGYAGSPSNELENMGTATQLGNQNYFDWLSNATDLYGEGLQGMQGMFNTGAQSSQSLVDSLSQALAAQAQLKYEAQAAQNKAQSSSGGNILGSLGDLAVNYFMNG